jgi:hypothetical protein
MGPALELIENRLAVQLPDDFFISDGNYGAGTGLGSIAS